MAESTSDFRGGVLADPGRPRDRDTMVGPLNRKPGSSDPKPWDIKPWDIKPSGATRRTAVGLILGAPLLGACAGVQQGLSSFSNPFSSQPGPSGAAQQPL